MREANSTKFHHPKSSVHLYQAGIQAITLQYHFIEKIFIFALLPELQTERQCDQGNKELEYIDTWRKQAYVCVCTYTHTQFNSVTQMPHVPILKLIFSAGLLLEQFQNISNMEWKTKSD